MKIGVIADTHGFLDPKIPKIFKGVDAILHGGDIGSMDVIRGLRAIAPVYAVRGNHEPEDVIKEFPNRQDQVVLEGKRIFLSHGFISFGWEFFEMMAGRYKEMFEKMQVDALVYGHSHFPESRLFNGVLFFCPGFAGEDVRDPGRAVGILTISDGKISGEIIRLLPDKP